MRTVYKIQTKTKINEEELKEGIRNGKVVILEKFELFSIKQFTDEAFEKYLWQYIVNQELFLFEYHDIEVEQVQIVPDVVLLESTEYTKSKSRFDANTTTMELYYLQEKENAKPRRPEEIGTAEEWKTLVSKMIKEFFDFAKENKWL